MAARIRSGPNYVEIILGAVLSLLLGGLLAVVYLVFKPVPILDVPPKQKEGAGLHYIAGRRGFSTGSWALKREAFLRGQTITLPEEEINAWIESLYPANAKPAKGEEDAMVQPGTPSVRFNGNTANLGAVLALDLFGWKPKIVTQAAGTFAMRGGTAKFVPDTVYVGSFPAHRLPVVGSLVFGRVTGMWKFPEELTSAWAKVSGVHIEKSQLVIEQPAS